jgi:lipopolysaccharide export system protein LptC
VEINEKRGHLTTDKPVEILGPLFTVKGQGLFADLKKETVRILSDVTTTIKREARIL